jgi:hypothetical protein
VALARGSSYLYVIAKAQLIGKAFALPLLFKYARLVKFLVTMTLLRSIHNTYLFDVLQKLIAHLLF